MNDFLRISFNNCLGAQKNHLIERVLLSTHNICFCLEIRKKKWGTHSDSLINFSEFHKSCKKCPQVFIIC